jgi:excisionase family DNA binding protein
MDTPADLKISEAAALLGVSVKTVRRWEDKGYLSAVRTPSGHRRFRRAEVEALLNPEAVA